MGSLGKHNYQISFNDELIILSELAGTDSCPPEVILMTVLINRTEYPLLNKGEFAHEQDQYSIGEFLEKFA